MSFPTQVAAAVPLEGEYTEWAHVWTRDYGEADLRLDGIIVNNSGTVYTEDSAGWDYEYVKTYDGVEVHPLGYSFFLWFNEPSLSATGKYVLGTPATSHTFEVWKDEVAIFSRDIQLDEANANEVYAFAISPNGKFIAINVIRKVTFRASVVMLYEGA